MIWLMGGLEPRAVSFPHGVVPCVGDRPAGQLPSCTQLGIARRT